MRVLTTITGCALAALLSIAQAQDACGPPGNVVSQQTVETDRERIEGYPDSDHGVPRESAVVVLEAGEIVWSHEAAMPGSGIVRVLSKDTASPPVCLRSPRPKAYGRFGSQVSAAGGMLGVLEESTGSAYVYDLVRLNQPPIKVSAPRMNALALTTDTLFGATSSGIIVFQRSHQWHEVQQIPWPNEMPPFSGRLASSKKTLVSTTSGLSMGDGYAPPGRVDVFRFTPHGWAWQARLTPERWPKDEPFGDECCVVASDSVVQVQANGRSHRFVLSATGWIEEVPGDE